MSGYFVRAGPLDAGRYFVAVSYESGDLQETRQSQVRLVSRGRFEALPVAFEWTVGRLMQLRSEFLTGPSNGWFPQGLDGSRLPTLPDGIDLGSVQVTEEDDIGEFLRSFLEVAGTPTEEGSFPFRAVVNSTFFEDEPVPVWIVINPPLALTVPRHLPVPTGRSFSRTLETAGGTAPIALSLTSGELPTGATIAAGAPRIDADGVAAGSVDVTLEAVDVAGSASDGSTLMVGCVPLDGKTATTPLAAGSASCGFFFDAVAGSTAAVVVRTAKKQPKRPLSASVYLPSGQLSTSHRENAGKGRATLKQIDCETTGRYFVVLDGSPGDATELEAKIKIAAPRKDKGTDDLIEVGEVLEVSVPAYAGAKLVFVGKFDRKAKNAATIRRLIAPDGTEMPLDGLVDIKKRSVKLTADLGMSGVWRIEVEGAGGPAGKFKYQAKVKQPKVSGLFLD